MFVGFDTSNYTTSVAQYSNSIITQQKKLLTVKSGEKGLRQNDAVFQHTVNMPNLINELQFNDIKAVAVSTRPRNIEGSYMPCFLVGQNVATAVAKTNNVPLYKTSHQVGHILAALYSCNRLDLINQEFIAFHISGGTTEALLVTPDNDNIINAKLIAQSNDLKAGQAIDRAGVMLGLDFPCGAKLDEMAQLSNKTFNIKPSMNGYDCSLSGVENKAEKMYEQGTDSNDIAKFVISYICTTLDKMLSKLMIEYKNMPIVFSGGVSSNSLIQSTLYNNYGTLFATPQFSCDNAAGISIFAQLKYHLDK